MKPSLMLFLAISLAAIKPARAQTNEIKPALIAVKQNSAPAIEISKNTAVIDTGDISVSIDFKGFVSCHGWVALHYVPNDLGIDQKEINFIGGCNGTFYRGLTVGATYYVSFTDPSGQVGYSQAVTVRAGFPPVIAYVSLPH
jgi:hypothetical protein